MGAQSKTRGYGHVDIKNYSKSWANGRAFCALAHKYFPEALDYSALRLGDKPDPKCIFPYLQSLYAKYTNFEKPLKTIDNPATQAAIEKGLGSIGIFVPKNS